MPSEKKKQSFIQRALSEISGFIREAFRETDQCDELIEALCELIDHHIRMSFRNGIDVGVKKARQKAKGKGGKVEVEEEAKGSSNAVLDRIRKAAGEEKR